MENNIILVSPQELHSLITDAVSVAVQQLISFPKKLEPPLPDYLTVEELSKYLKLAKPTLYFLTSNRKIPFIKRGKRILFERVSVIKWLEEGKKLTKNFNLINNIKNEKRG